MALADHESERIKLKENTELGNDLIFPGSGKKPEYKKPSQTTPVRKTGAVPGVKNIKEEKLPTEKTVVENKFSYTEGETKPYNAGNIKKDSTVNDDYIAKKRRRRRIRNKILLYCGMGILGLLIGVVIFAFWYKNYLFSKIEFIEPNENVTFINEEGEVVNISQLREELKPDIPVIEKEHIHNFLLIGVDSRSRSYSQDDKGALADVIMIMSIDDKEGTLKLVSIARDSYVYVPGYTNPMKINAAMSKGGPDLLWLTVENTLRIPIDGYAYVNFYNMANVIDACGGVYINVTSSELYSNAGLNDNLREINEIAGYAPDFQMVNQTGDIWVNGRQAVAYARIRHVGNGDYERSERQVEVLRSLLNQFMNMSLTGKAACLDDILGLFKTSVSQEEIEDYALDFLPSLKNAKILYFQLPLEGFFNSGMYGDEWSIRNNWNMTIPYVQEFLYGEQKEFKPVDEIPNAPSDDKCPDTYDVEGHIQG